MLNQRPSRQISRAAKTIDPTFPAIEVMVVPDPTINASCGIASRLQVHAGLLAAVEVWEAQGDVESAGTCPPPNAMSQHIDDSTGLRTVTDDYNCVV